MRLLVVAQSPEEFREWNSQQTPVAKTPASPAALLGEQVFRNDTCVQCHSIRGVNANTSLGPDLTHFASRQTIGAGVLENNAADLRRWLTDPQRIKPGCNMPDFQLDESNVERLDGLFRNAEVTTP
jgi:cytochrome c oxidase subunit 2